MKWHGIAGLLANRKLHMVAAVAARRPSYFAGLRSNAVSRPHGRSSGGVHLVHAVQMERRACGMAFHAQPEAARHHLALMLGHTSWNQFAVCFTSAAFCA